MAETVKINDIASQLSTASRLVVDTDFFWIYMGNGTQVKIPAEWVRAYLTNGITPTVGENGHWIVGGADTGVVAEGKTPQFRGGAMGIEVSYDNGSTWTQCVAYTDIAPQLEPLIEEYERIVNSEQSRKDAETARTSAEKKRAAAETARANAEAERAAAETEREQSFAESKQAADDAADRANDVASHQPYIGEDLYWYLYDEATKTYNKTDKYSKGDNFSIKATFESIAEMEAHVNTEALTLVVGDFVIISTDVEEEDNAKLYVVASVADGKPTYRYIDDFSGSRGFTGHTPQISIGTITTLPAGSSASSTLTEDGVDENGNPRYKLNLAIPKGDTFTYDDLTAENIADLQRPAKEATEAANAAAELATSKAEAAQTAAELWFDVERR